MFVIQQRKNRELEPWDQFNKNIGNQEEKIESIQTYADQLIQSEHYAGPDINNTKQDVLERWEKL